MINDILASEFDFGKNYPLTPADFTPFANKDVHWIGKCGHSWFAKVSNRANGTGCPVCSGQKTLAGFNDLQTKNPELAKRWLQYKNGDVTPSQISPKSSKSYWWLCINGHEYFAKVSDCAYGKGMCSICKGHKTLAGYNDLASQGPELFKQIHPTKNPDVDVYKLTPYSHKRIVWLCDLGHHWPQTVGSRFGQKGRGCPYCLGAMVWEGFNDLQFKAPELAKEWHPEENGNLKPTQVTCCSHKEVIWQCPKDVTHIYPATIKNRFLNKTNCPFCCHTYTQPEKFLEEKLGVRKFNKSVLKFSKIKYQPDIKLSENLFINGDGLYWHSEQRKDTNYHLDMRKSYEAEGKRIFQFYEDELYAKWTIIESIINNALGKITNKIQARKCELKSIEGKDATIFLEINHLMGQYKASKSIGLYVNNELISILSYRIIKKKNKIEIARFGSKINTVVIGAFGKLLSRLKEIAKLNNITQIESFCDLRYATGSSYEKLGFVAQKETLGWCWTDNLKRYNRLMCMAGNGKTEEENAKEKKWYRIYDAGQRKYVLTL